MSELRSASGIPIITKRPNVYPAELQPAEQNVNTIVEGDVIKHSRTLDFQAQSNIN